MRASLTLSCCLTAVALSCEVGGAAQVTYQFNTTVQMINRSAPNFPPLLAGVTVGAAVTGTISYDAASPPVSNPFLPPFSLATPYTLLNATATFNIGGVLLGASTPPHTCFVWNNDPINGGGSNDGLLYTNILAPGPMVFQVGNIQLPTTALADESLPSGNVTGAFVLEFLAPGGAGTAWLRTNGWQNLTTITPCIGNVATGGGSANAVNIDDLLAVIGAWGACPAAPAACPANVVNAGASANTVNIDDLLAVIGAWGPCP